MGYLTELTKVALVAIRSNLTRSLLTMLGVIIGVFSVVMMISLGQGVQNYITDEFNALGSNLLFVSPGNVSFGGDPATSLTRNPLDETHIKLIQNYAGNHIVSITPYYLIGDTTRYKANEYFSEVIAFNEDGMDMFHYVLMDGRKINSSDIRSSNRVAIIGPVIQKELFNSTAPINKTIKINGDSYTVIGTFEEKGSNYDDQILIPYTSAEDTFGLENYASIVAKIDSAENISITSKRMEISLLRDLEDEEFSVISQQDILSTIQETLGVLTLGLGLIAGISLVVGGIGIMNIMLVSVSERIREIGLRKALGATSKIIALQFLIESIILSIVGGLFGLLLGWVGTLIAQNYFRAEIPLYAVFMSFGFSVFVGIVFGTYPALQASRRDPITSLRYE